MCSRKKQHRKETIDVFDKHTSKLVGTIKRSPLAQRAFGNHGAIQYSIAGERIWSVGGRDVFLKPGQIAKLRERGELK